MASNAFGFYRNLNQTNTVVSIVLLSVVIFLIDVFTPIEWAFWLLYLIPLLMASRVGRPAMTYVYAVIFSALVFLADFLQPLTLSPMNVRITLLNDALRSGGIFCISILLIKYRKADEAAREMGRKFYSTVEESQYGVFLAQDDGIVYTNRELEKLYGYSRPEMVGMGLLDLIHPDDRAIMRDIFYGVTKGDISKFAERTRILKKGGKSASVTLVGSCTIYNDRPAITGTVVEISADTAKLT